MSTEGYLALSSMAYSTFSDIITDVYKPTIQDLIEAGLINGYRDAGGSISPQYAALSIMADWQLIKFTSDPISGFVGTAFRNPTTGEIVFSFRGTNLLDPRDILTDIGLAITRMAPQFDDAYNFVKDVMNMSGMAPACFATDQALNQYLSNTTNVSFTGHSLGGALAEYITWRTGQDDANPSDGIGAQSVTFNAPGIATYVLGAGLDATIFDTVGLYNVVDHVKSMTQAFWQRVVVISEQLRDGRMSYGY